MVMECLEVPGSSCKQLSLSLLTILCGTGDAASADAAARVGEVWTRMADTVGRDSDWGTPPLPSTLLGVAPFPAFHCIYSQYKLLLLFISKNYLFGIERGLFI
jgi:hypothetical protein